MVPSCHSNFKPELDQVSTDTGEQCFDMGQQGKTPRGLESCLLGAEKARHALLVSVCEMQSKK